MLEVSPQINHVMDVLHCWDDSICTTDTNESVVQGGLAIVPVVKQFNGQSPKERCCDCWQADRPVS